jgi:hypothetical protein
MGPATAPASVAAVLALLGIGIGLTVQLVVLATQGAVPRRDVGAATAMVTLARSIGTTLGIAVFGLIFNAVLTPELVLLGADPPHAALAAATARGLTAAFAAAIPVLLVGVVAAFAFRPPALARQ